MIATLAKKKNSSNFFCLQGTMDRSSCIYLTQPLFKIHMHPSCKSTFMPIVQIMKIMTLCNVLLGRGHFPLIAARLKKFACPPPGSAKFLACTLPGTMAYTLQVP